MWEDQQSVPGHRFKIILNKNRTDLPRLKPQTTLTAFHTRILLLTTSIIFKIFPRLAFTVDTLLLELGRVGSMNVCLNENTICAAGRKTQKTCIYHLNMMLSSRTEASLLVEVRKIELELSGERIRGICMSGEGKKRKEEKVG